jgi:short-subunit dehydrogenase
MKNILIIGATSAIAAACARAWIAAGARFFLVARDAGRLAQVADDLRARGADVAGTWNLDATDIALHAPALATARSALGKLDIALIAHGTLPDQPSCERDAAQTAAQFTLNATTTIALMTGLANVLEAQRHGTLAVITSVAGERGRASNYVYGSAKAAVSTFCDGLRIRLGRSGVHVVDVRPGFVATPMTAGLPLPAALVASPDEAAGRIVAGIERRADVVYAPSFWRWIMLVIRWIPGFVFRRMIL